MWWLYFAILAALPLFFFVTAIILQFTNSPPLPREKQDAQKSELVIEQHRCWVRRYLFATLLLHRDVCDHMMRTSFITLYRAARSDALLSDENIKKNNWLTVSVLSDRFIDLRQCTARYYALLRSTARDDDSTILSRDIYRRLLSRLFSETMYPPAFWELNFGTEAGGHYVEPSEDIIEKTRIWIESLPLWSERHCEEEAIFRFMVWHLQKKEFTLPMRLLSLWETHSRHPFERVACFYLQPQTIRELVRLLEKEKYISK
jgi:hypothetical protein